MLKIKHNILSAALLSLVLVSFSAVAGKPVAISKGDGNNSLEIGLSVTVGEHKIMSRPEQDTDRTDEDGKASSVHFLHFDFTEELIKEFFKEQSTILLGFSHKNYKHFSELSLEVKSELKKDFDIN